MHISMFVLDGWQAGMSVFGCWLTVHSLYEIGEQFYLRKLTAIARKMDARLICTMVENSMGGIHCGKSMS